VSHGPVIGRLNQPLTIPPMESGRSDEPLDLQTLLIPASTE